MLALHGHHSLMHQQESINLGPLRQHISGICGGDSDSHRTGRNRVGNMLPNGERDSLDLPRDKIESSLADHTQLTATLAFSDPYS